MVLTDQPALAQAAEFFFEEHPEYPLSIRYTTLITTEGMKRINADLLLGKGLNSTEMLENMSPLNRKDGPLVDDPPLYPALMNPVRPKGKPLLLPISFGLPMILGKKENTRDLPDPMLISPEVLYERSRDWSQTNDRGRFIKKGFSPSWNGLFLLNLLMIRHPGSLGSGDLAPDLKAMESVLKEGRSWMTSPSSPGADSEFTQRYRYIPDEKLLSDGRILFALYDFSLGEDLLGMAGGNLDFRYLSGPRTIPLIDVVYAGIPKKAPQKKAARAFLRWLLDPRVQTSLMNRWQQQRAAVFGLLGGFSSRQDINEGPLPEIYPWMEGKIPEAHYLAPVQLVPNRWPRVKEEVFLPWMVETLREEETTGTLENRYKTWDLSSLDEDF